MKRHKVIIFFAIIVIITPFLGFPLIWREIIEILAGLIILGLASWIYWDNRDSQEDEIIEKDQTFIENKSEVDLTDNLTDEEKESE